MRRIWHFATGECQMSRNVKEKMASEKLAEKIEELLGAIPNYKELLKETRVNIEECVFKLMIQAYEVGYKDALTTQ